MMMKSNRPAGKHWPINVESGRARHISQIAAEIEASSHALRVNVKLIRQS